MAKRELSDADRAEFAAERREQLELWQSKLTEKVADLVNGDQWQRWLDVAARFTSYSFRNSLLILLQRPDATAVAGYKAWQRSFGRQVNRGEVGIKILAPVTRRADKVAADGRPVLDQFGQPVKETLIVGVRLATVFDVSQTAGRELPEQPVPKLLIGQAPPGLWEGLQRFVEEQGFRVTRGPCDGANGITNFAVSEVRVRSDMDDAAAVKTLAHEAAHVLLHSTAGLGGEQVCRGRREVEAESAAYLVTKAHGLDSGQYTFNYVAGWADHALRSAPAGVTLTDVVSQTGARVVNAADTILAATRPPRLSDHLTQSMVARVEQTIATDRAMRAATRSPDQVSSSKHARQMPPQSSTRSVSPVCR